MTAERRSLRSLTEYRLRRTRAPKSAEQPEERSDEAAIAAKQSDLRAPKMTAEPFGDCKSEVASHFLDTLSDRDIVGGLKVEAKQWLGVGRAQVEPPVATVHG